MSENSRIKEEFEEFVDYLFDNAIVEFHSTKQYELLKEKLDRMGEDCKNMFMKDEQRFADECFSFLLDMSSQQERYVYKKGLTDCVVLLKELGVLT